MIAPDATCASTARRHVTTALDALGRSDLIDAAQLAVTELATNAALHARTPVTVAVRVRAGGEVRIEVGDGSATMPTQYRARATSTIGRGLRLVAALGRWGVEPMVEGGHRIGKVVWFAPTERPDITAPGDSRKSPESVDTTGFLGVAGTTGDLDGGDGTDRHRTPGAHGESQPSLVTVELLNFPLLVFAETSQHHDELVRELALLSLQPTDSSELSSPPARLLGSSPAPLTELTDQLRRRFGTLNDLRHEARDAAARGYLTTDLTHQVPVTAATELVGLANMLEEAEVLCRTGHLLTLPATEIQQEFTHWFVAQVVRQSHGEHPTPWTGAVVSAPEPPRTPERRPRRPLHQ